MTSFYPSDRDQPLKSSRRWLAAKVKDDDCQGLWRWRSLFTPRQPNTRVQFPLTLCKQVRHDGISLCWYQIPKQLQFRLTVETPTESDHLMKIQYSEYTLCQDHRIWSSDDDVPCVRTTEHECETLVINHNKCFIMSIWYVPQNISMQYFRQL